MKTIREQIYENSTLNDNDRDVVFNLALYFDQSSRPMYEWMMNIIKSLKRKPIDEISFNHFVNSSILDKKVSELVKEYSKEIERVTLSKTAKAELKKYLTSIIFNTFEDEIGKLPNWSDDERYNYMDIDW